MAKKIRVTKEVVFEAAHKLNNYIGACANMHGHSYKLQVGIEGTPEQLDSRGLLVDFKELKAEISDKILSKWDHALLNDIITDRNSTAENMVQIIFEALNPWAQSRGCKVCVVRLWETATSFAELINED